MTINDKVAFIELYDIYYELLTKRQQEIVELIFDDDYSVTEVADQLNVSKAAVSKTVKEIKEKLDEFEDKLKIISNYKANVKLLESNNIDPNIIGQIKK